MAYKIQDADAYNATGLLNDPPALRARAETDGFLFFKGLVPVEAVMDLRRAALELIRKEGLLSNRHDVMQGVADMDACSRHYSYGVTCVTKAIYHAVQKLPLFHELAHHPNILSMYAALFGEEVLVHPRHIMRLVIPGKNVHPTPSHQDIVYIHGTTNTWTSWIPLGDCPIEVGNLAFLKGSHKAGVLPVSSAEGAGGLTCDTTGVEGDWVYLNYDAGDLVTFPATMVHKSVPTQRPERVRLSLDYRYQPVSEPVHDESLEPHMNVCGWDEIYRDWPNDTYQYYWRRQPVTTTTLRSQELYPQLKRSSSAT